MERKKISYVGYIVGEVLFALMIIGFGVATAFIDSDAKMICYVMMAVGGIALLAVVLMHIGTALNEKKRIANVNNPSTVAHALFAEDSKYDYYFAIPNRAGQAARNAVANTVGALSFLFLGGGVFSYGKNTVDAFVSEGELIINDKSNPMFSDDKLKRFPASAVQDVQFETKGKYERVHVSFVNSSEGLVLDVDASKCGSQRVRDSFSKLLRREGEEKPFEDFPAEN